MSTLILSLPASAPTADAEWRYVLSGDGRHVIRSGSCAASLLPAPGRAGETVAVVPARQLSWQRVTLPHGALAQTQRLRVVLEGLLEEQLLDEPERLHFALPPHAATGAPIWVAVCDRAWLRASLQFLETAGHRVDRIVPACAPGATASGGVEATVIGTPDEATLVLCGVGEEQAVSLLPLQAQVAAHLLAPDTPLRAEPAVAELAERHLGRSVALQSLDEGLLDAARSAWDLAQFDLASNGRQRALRWLGTGANALWRAPEWHAARWALGLLAVVQIAALNLWAWQDGRALARQQAAVRGVLTQTFPQVKLVVDAPVQINKEVALLRLQTGALSASDLESLLAAAARHLPAGQTPARIDFADGRLRLTGLTLAPEQLAALQHQLAAQGLA
ncbi:MAG: general secretion pathway protein GspL, partial [Burkholderiales bacterium]|nr:general secretion pathway protein GspL [Burkholderiales bacterium]